MTVRDFIRNNILLFIVFITGAAVLVLEVSATRILAPYFGNTIYTVSSVISVILLALSIGYYVGGRLADKKATLFLFYSIIALSGFTVFILYLLIIFLLPKLGNLFSLHSGPLFSSLILFLFPNFLLGLLSPVVAKLQKMSSEKSGIGRITGDVFFWSTLGSILGSLATGFIFIPFFGIDTIVIGVGISLTIIGLLGLSVAGMNKNTLSKLLLLSLFIGGFSLLLFIAKAHAVEKTTVYSQDGVYEKLIIFDGSYKGKPTRFFQQDKSNSGAMFLDSSELVYDYTKYYAIYKLVTPQIQHALVIGGGAYSIPKALLNNNSEVQVDVAEIEPSLFDLSKKYFNVPTTPRLKNYVADGRRFLHDSPHQYDLIFSDVYYSLYSIPTHFVTQDFFELSKQKLNPNGFFVANIIGSFSRSSPSFILSEIKTFQTVYPNSYFFAVTSQNSLYPQNIIAVGYNSSEKLNFEKAKKSSDTFLQSIPKTQVSMERFDLSSYPIFTDNYAPVDYYITQTLDKLDSKKRSFSGEEALALIKQQTNYGSRYLSSDAHQKEENFLKAELAASGATVITQSFEQELSNGKKQKLTNIIGRILPEKKNRIILGSHYDSKRFADKDPENTALPVPGANDSASGVAVLLHLAHLLAFNNPTVGIDIVFFDGEEGAHDLKKDPWQPIGSTYFAKNLNWLYPNTKPQEALIIDMVCDKDLTIYQEKNSLQYAPKQVTAFWKIAPKHSNAFIAEPKYQIADDHTPLAKAGIPSQLIIDFDYPAFHTTMDTSEQCSEKSLEIVGNTILDYIASLK